MGQAAKEQLFLNRIDTHLLLTPQASINGFPANMDMEIGILGFEKPQVGWFACFIGASEEADGGAKSWGCTCTERHTTAWR